MASRTRTAWEERSPVASELEAIFAPLPRLAPVSAGTDTASPKAGPRGRLPRWLLLLGIVALAALAGSLVFLTPVARQAPQPHRAMRVAGSAPPPIVAPAPRVPPMIESAPETFSSARLHASTPAPAAAPAPMPARAPARPRREARPAHPGRCPRFATEAWCLHGTIMRSDDELRDAYDAAVRAGVDRNLLVDIRSDWKRLRGRANDDPQALIRGYALLTQELHAETRRAQR